MKARIAIIILLLLLGICISIVPFTYGTHNHFIISSKSTVIAELRSIYVNTTAQETDADNDFWIYAPTNWTIVTANITITDIYAENDTILRTGSHNIRSGFPKYYTSINVTQKCYLSNLTVEVDLSSPGSVMIKIFNATDRGDGIPIFNRSISPTLTQNLGSAGVHILSYEFSPPLLLDPAATYENTFFVEVSSSLVNFGIGYFQTDNYYDYTGSSLSSGLDFNVNVTLIPSNESPVTSPKPSEINFRLNGVSGEDVAKGEGFFLIDVNASSSYVNATTTWRKYVNFTVANYTSTLINSTSVTLTTIETADAIYFKYSLETWFPGDENVIIIWRDESATLENITHDGSLYTGSYTINDTHITINEASNGTWDVWLKGLKTKAEIVSIPATVEFNQTFEIYVDYKFITNNSLIDDASVITNYTLLGKYITGEHYQLIFNASTVGDVKINITFSRAGCESATIIAEVKVSKINVSVYIVPPQGALYVKHTYTLETRFMSSGHIVGLPVTFKIEFSCTNGSKSVIFLNSTIKSDMRSRVEIYIPIGTVGAMVYVIFNGTDYILPANASYSLSISKVPILIEIITGKIFFGKNEIKIRVTDVLTGAPLSLSVDVTVKYDGSEDVYHVDIVNGEGVLYLEMPYGVSSCNVTVSYKGDEYYASKTIYRVYAVEYPSEFYIIIIGAVLGAGGVVGGVFAVYNAHKTKLKTFLSLREIHLKDIESGIVYYTLELFKPLEVDKELIGAMSSALKALGEEMGMKELEALAVGEFTIMVRTGERLELDIYHDRAIPLKIEKRISKVGDKLIHDIEMKYGQAITALMGAMPDEKLKAKIDNEIFKAFGFSKQDLERLRKKLEKEREIKSKKMKEEAKKVFYQIKELEERLERIEKEYSEGKISKEDVDKKIIEFQVELGKIHKRLQKIYEKYK